MSTHESDNLTHPPVLKIGAVVLRSVASREALVARHQSPVASEEAVQAVPSSPLAGEGWGEGALSDAQNTHTPPTNLPPQGGEASCVAPLSPLTTHDSRLTHHQFLIIQPIPKTPGEVPPFVLPRGSRQYQDANGNWQDARDEATGTQHAATLEPFVRALERELAEEAGVSSAMLARARVVELGDMMFTSRSKGTYPIHWFVVIPAPEDAALLGHELPEDATAIAWASLDDIKAMAATGEFSAGYVAVIEVALQTLHTKP